ncbi:hypothetical protein J2Z21_002513 [Streptomyces griseochromogenes]|uniref:Uncharacterized protein n=1 Tax=Streptomyces griseochromogenes TaxID=68214 RepID=A0A1B1AQS4_9ACTN|nr:hypothetical protein [Streptomyces griseochromogenes]ANP48921.1 hypothetical protein AVL59_04425 [Streptomyces griseochromogenes]MBP2049582.1 hypothetical protein [Streptomyces griseochromogenes]
MDVDRVGRGAAHGAALAMTPYALIKLSWVVGAVAGLLPIGRGFDMADWVVLNTVTIGMAGIGIVMALALVRPWGMRIPGPLVAFVAWVGTGFLVPLLPYAVLDALLGLSDGRQRHHDDDGPSVPGWEAALIQISFVGMGLGLAVALPVYLRRRWPQVFAGRVGDAGGSGSRLVPWAVGAAAVIGVVWCFWALGGTVGMAHPAERSPGGRLLDGVWGVWALTASAATWTVSRGRPSRLPRRLPLTLGWLGTGSLFAWSAWKLPLTVYLAVARPAAESLPEDLALATVLHLGAVVAGAVMLTALVHRREPLRPSPRPVGSPP